MLDENGKVRRDPASVARFAMRAAALNRGAWDRSVSDVLAGASRKVIQLRLDAGQAA